MWLRDLIIVVAVGSLVVGGLCSIRSKGLTREIPSAHLVMVSNSVTNSVTNGP